MSIDSSRYVKAPDKVRGALRANKDGSVTVVKPITLQVPYRYQDKKFIDIGERVRVIGCYALVLDDKYFAIDSCTAMFETSPTKINEITVDDEAYFELEYEAGDLLLVQSDVLVDKENVHPISTEFFSNGRLPWYFEPEEILAIYPNLEDWNGVNLRTDMAVYGILLSLMERSPNDVNVPFRVGMKSKEAFTKTAPVFIGTSKVDLIVTGTIAKLSGPYLNPSITSALNVESTEIGDMEYLVRA